MRGAGGSDTMPQTGCLGTDRGPTSTAISSSTSTSRIDHGMWAELLQNRKFAGHDSVYYGVVNAWAPIGADTLRVYPGAFKGADEGFHADDPARYMHDNTIYYAPGFHGQGQSQRIEVLRATGTLYGVCQDNLGLKAGQRYIGYVMLRAEGPIHAQVELAGETREVGPLMGLAARPS